MAYMTTKDAATFCGVSPAALKKWRELGRGPKWYRPSGTRRVLYSQADLDAWIAGGEVGGLPGAAA